MLQIRLKENAAIAIARSPPELVEAVLEPVIRFEVLPYSLSRASMIFGVDWTPELMEAPAPSISTNFSPERFFKLHQVGEILDFGFTNPARGASVRASVV